MLKVFFGEWKSGRVQRLAYLGYYLLSMFLIVVFAMGIGFVMGFLSHSDMNMRSLEGLTNSSSGIAIAVIFIVFLFAIFAAQLNILAKRIRDMGLPALATVLSLIILFVVLNLLYPPQEVSFTSTMIAEANTTMATAETTMQSSREVSLFGLIVFLLLLFVPSDAFKRVTKR